MGEATSGGRTVLAIGACGIAGKLESGVTG